MAMAEKMSEPDGAELIDVALRLDHGAHELLVELTQRTGWDASELVGWALGAYWRELEGIVLPPPPADEEPLEPVVYPDDDFRRHFTAEQVASIERGLADIEAGRTFSHEEVMSELRAKYGW